jgi:type II secretory pathway component GspD/PulD (secretin)
VGRLFRSERWETVSNELLFFVTATIVDEENNRVNDPEK